MAGSGKLALVVSSSRDRPDLALASALMSAGSLFIVVVDGDKLGETALCLLLLCVVVSRCCVVAAPRKQPHPNSSVIFRYGRPYHTLVQSGRKVAGTWSEGGRKVAERGGNVVGTDQKMFFNR